jgi:GNAT superfamily N-acetyltransferase
MSDLVKKMFEDYVAERGAGSLIHYTEEGFITYHLSEDEVFVEDLYVIPSCREKGTATKFADYLCEIGKKNGAKFFTGGVYKLAKNAATSRKVLIAYGMQLHAEDDEMEWYYKEI